MHARLSKINKQMMHQYFIFQLFSVQNTLTEQRRKQYCQNQNQNQNSLLVIRQIDNPSPGAVTGGKLVPSSHKRGELRYAII